jgi:signal transduction histidine kinase
MKIHLENLDAQTKSSEEFKHCIEILAQLNDGKKVQQNSA